jgi:hypothetical protein
MVKHIKSAARWMVFLNQRDRWRRAGLNDWWWKEYLALWGFAVLGTPIACVAHHDARLLLTLPLVWAMLQVIYFGNAWLRVNNVLHWRK